MVNHPKASKERVFKHLVGKYGVMDRDDFNANWNPRRMEENNNWLTDIHKKNMRAVPMKIKGTDRIVWVDGEEYRDAIDPRNKKYFLYKFYAEHNQTPFTTTMYGISCNADGDMMSEFKNKINPYFLEVIPDEEWPEQFLKEISTPLFHNLQTVNNVISKISNVCQQERKNIQDYLKVVPDVENNIMKLIGNGIQLEFVVDEDCWYVTVNNTRKPVKNIDEWIELWTSYS